MRMYVVSWRDSKQWFTQRYSSVLHGVRSGGQRVKFQVDTGATCNII